MVVFRPTIVFVHWWSWSIIDGYEVHSHHTQHMYNIHVRSRDFQRLKDSTLIGMCGLMFLCLRHAVCDLLRCSCFLCNGDYGVLSAYSASKIVLSQTGGPH